MTIFFIGTNHFAANILNILYKNNITISHIITKYDGKYGRGLKTQAYPVKYIAQKYKLNIYETASINSKECNLFLKTKSPSIIILVDYGEKIENDIINIPKYGIINVHPSILPLLRGATPIEHAIINGDNQTGVSIIKINDKIDAGDILKILYCKISKQETYDSLLKKLTNLAGIALISTINDIVSKKVSILIQDENQATYAPKLQKNFYRINWFDSALTINRKIRSTFSKKKHFTQFNNSFINIIETSVIIRYKKNMYSPGTITKISKFGIDVITSKDILRIKKIQFHSKNIINIKDNFKNLFFYIGNNFI